MPTYREDEHLGQKVPLVETDDILKGAVTTDKISDGAVTTEKIADGAVTTEKLADNSVTGEKIQDHAITPQQLPEDFVVTERMIADQAIGTDKIADNAVTTPKIANQAVTTEKIADQNVTEEKLAPGAVTTEKLADGMIEQLQTITDVEPTPGSVKPLQSGGAASVLGHYIENPEFVRVYLDNEGKVLWGIKTDGDLFFGCGVPSQIREYVEMKVKEMSPEGYGDIINFLDGLEFGDKKLQELLDEKVDKAEGKSLIDEEFANGIHYEENPEFVEVKLNGEDKILEAIYKDGTKLLPAGYNINGVTVNTVDNPEFLAVWLDDSNHILFALEKDGNVVFAAGVPKQIIEYVNEIIKPFEELLHFEDNPEFIETTLDAEGKITEATRTDGTKVLPAGAEFGGNVITSESNPEYLELTTDAEDKIISSIDAELEDIRYGGINLSEMKRDADCDVLQCGFDEDRDEIYTIENNDSTITMEVDDDWNVYEVKDSRHTAEIVMEDNGEVYLEQTIKEI